MIINVVEDEYSEDYLHSRSAAHNRTHRSLWRTRLWIWTRVRGPSGSIRSRLERRLFWIGAFKHSDGADMDCSFGLCQAMLIQLDSHFTSNLDQWSGEIRAKCPLSQTYSFAIGAFKTSKRPMLAPMFGLCWAQVAGSFFTYVGRILGLFWGMFSALEPSLDLGSTHVEQFEPGHRATPDLDLWCMILWVARWKHESYTKMIGTMDNRSQKSMAPKMEGAPPFCSVKGSTR